MITVKTKKQTNRVECGVLGTGWGAWGCGGAVNTSCPGGAVCESGPTTIAPQKPIGTVPPTGHRGVIRHFLELTLIYLM